MLTDKDWIHVQKFFKTKYELDNFLRYYIIDIIDDKFYMYKYRIVQDQIYINGILYDYRDIIDSSKLELCLIKLIGD